MLRRILLAAALASAAPDALALDGPHDQSEAISCKQCHIAHGAPGGALTSVAGNANLCDSCHKSQTGYGFPWSTDHQAVPGSQGVHHRWDANATSAAHGALPPRTTATGNGYEAMAARLVGGTNLQCSTCHDQHAATTDPTWSPGKQNVSVAVGTALPPDSGSGGTLTLLAPAADASPKGYLVEIVAGGFRLSNDRGTSWFGCSSPGVYAAYTGANACATGANVALNDGAKVRVTFAGTPAVATRWSFYVSYPFLRANQANDGMCLECHRDRVQSAQRVEGADPTYVPDGNRGFSHPVGEGLAKSYDRPTILDADGSTAGDGNPTNDVVLVNGKVSCTTCHAPHNADSNSLTVDP